MKKAYILYRCWNCKHSFATRKRKRRHQCSKCGIRETKSKSFNRWTVNDILVLIDFYEHEPPVPDPKTTPHRPIIPEIKPRCWGEKWNYADKHCTNKCDVRKSCKKEFEYQEYKKGLLPDETSQ